MEESQAIYDVLRTRIVGTMCLLVPQDLQGLGGTSTPSFLFCQLAFQLTQQFLRISPLISLGMFQFYIQKWDEEISKTKGVASCGGRSSIWREHLEKQPPPTQVCVRELGGQQCQDRARPGVPCLPRNGPGRKVRPVIIKLLLTREQMLPCTFQSCVLRIRESTQGPRFLGDACALQLALWRTQQGCPAGIISPAQPGLDPGCLQGF